jgi:hypothetical protein
VGLFFVEIHQEILSQWKCDSWQSFGGTGVSPAVLHHDKNSKTAGGTPTLQYLAEIH